MSSPANFNNRRRRRSLPFLVESLENRTLLSNTAALYVPDVGVIRGPLVPFITGPVSTQPEITGAKVKVQHNKPFTITLGSFQDPSPADPSAYTATIDWGDGSTSPATIQPNTNGGFDLVGSSTLPWGIYTATTTISRQDDPDWQQIITSQITSLPPGFSGKAKQVHASLFHRFNGIVATYVGIDPNYLDQYSATVSWGDGGYSSDEDVSLIPAGDGVVNVVASHVYTHGGLYNTRVELTQSSSARGVVSWLDGASYFSPAMIECNAKANVDVGPGVFTRGSIIPIRSELFVPYSGPIAEFTFNGPASDLSNYTVSVTADGQAIPGRLVHEYRSVYEVQTDTFFTSGYDIDITITDRRRPADDNLAGSAEGWIGSAYFPLNVVAFDLNPIAGQEWSGEVGELSGGLSSAYASTTFTATIEWGDGTQSPAQLQPQDDGSYAILGSHTYDDASDYQGRYVSVLVTAAVNPTDPRLAGQTYSSDRMDYTYTVVEPSEFPGFSIQLMNLSTVAGQGLDYWIGKLMAGDDALAQLPFSGQIVWDDGSTSSLSFIQGNYPRKFWIGLDRQFDQAGTISGTLTITSGDISQSIPVSVEVEPPPPPPLPPPPALPQIGWINIADVLAIKGKEFSGTIGTFYPVDSSIPAEGYEVNVNWDDGHTSEGTLVDNGDGTWSVVASHTYDSDDWDDAAMISIYIAPVPSSDGQAQYLPIREYGEIELDDNPDLVSLSGVGSLSFRQREKINANLAHFLPPESMPDAAEGDFTATIDWGDGSTSTGIITSDHEGGFDVSGNHIYAGAGDESVKITIASPGGDVSTTDWLTLIHDPVVLEPASPSFEGLNISGLLARFTNEDTPIDPALLDSYYAALVDWGDGSVVAGKMTNTDDGNAAVNGSHTYAKPGTYTVDIIVRYNPHDTYIYRTPRWYSYDWTTGDAAFALAAHSEPALSSSVVAIAHPDSFHVRYKIRITAPENQAPTTPAHRPRLAHSPHHPSSLVTAMNTMASHAAHLLPFTRLARKTSLFSDTAILDE